MTAPRPPSKDLLTSLLRDVSRSFYLTLRALPGVIRAPVGLAYLLARTTDTIADTDVLPVADRLRALEALRGRMLGARPHDPLDFGRLVGHQASESERQLLDRVEEALTVLMEFPPDDQRRIRDVLAIIISGQELDLRRFEGAGERRVIALPADADLEDYTYRVAGCVGEFWTRMCVAHLFAAPTGPDPSLTGDGWFESSGVRFGKGLQLVNILRDLSRDLRQGRCYLPADGLAKAGLKPEDLLAPESEARLRPFYDMLLDRAEGHLAAGWSYTCAIPRACVRLRLACAWPVLIGARTLSALRSGRILDPARRIKISRADVRTIVSRSVIALVSESRWRSLFDRTKGAGA